MSRTADRERALELADQWRALGTVSVATFFGGTGIRLDGVQFAFIIGGVIYFRVNEQSRPDYETLGSSPFKYAGHKKQVTVGSYYRVPDEIIDDMDEVRAWAAKAHKVAASARSVPRRGSARSIKAVRR